VLYSSQAKTCSMDGLNRLMDINVVEPVTIGAIATRLYFYYSCTHEVSGDLAEIRR
jgi:26S proteasome regulatory subunit N3